MDEGPARRAVNDFGLQGSGQLTDGVPDPGRYRAVAELAEELGFDSIWAGEHLSFHNPILDLGVALSAFAAWTSRIALGAGIVLLPLRHPSLVAKQAASLDYLSAGGCSSASASAGRARRTSRRQASPSRSADVARTRRSPRCARCFDRRRRSGARSTTSPASRSLRARRRKAGRRFWSAGNSAAARRRAGTLGDGWLPYLVSARRYAEGLADVTGMRRQPAATLDRRSRRVVLFALVGDGRCRARSAEHLSRRYGMRFEPHHVERPLRRRHRPRSASAGCAAEAAGAATSLDRVHGNLDFVDQCRLLADIGVRCARRIAVARRDTRESCPRPGDP